MDIAAITATLLTYASHVFFPAILAVAVIFILAYWLSSNWAESKLRQNARTAPRHQRDERTRSFATVVSATTVISFLTLGIWFSYGSFVDTPAQQTVGFMGTALATLMFISILASANNWMMTQKEVYTSQLR